jgi:hypothetical protein
MTGRRISNQRKGLASLGAIDLRKFILVVE